MISKRRTNPTCKLIRGRAIRFLRSWLPVRKTIFLLDPSIKKLAEQIAKYQSQNQMAEQCQKTSHAATQDGLPKLDDKKYISTMRQVMENPTFMTMAEHLGYALMQDPSVSSMLEIFTNPSNEGQLKERTARINEDPYFKQILDEIENGGPDVMMRYWNDKEVLKKLGHAMGFPQNSGVAAAASKNSGPEETEDVGNEDESIVLHTDNVDGVEVKRAQFLLEIGAKVDALDKNMNATRHHEAGYDKKECVALLRENSASVIPQNMDGETPIDVAKLNNQDDSSSSYGCYAVTKEKRG